MTRVVRVRFDPLTYFSVMRIGSFFFQFPFVRHDTKVDVVPVTSHDPLRHSMVILPQNVLTIHRVYVLTNLKQSTCTTLNKVYTTYSVYHQPNFQRDSSRMKIFDGRLDVDVRQNFQSWRVSLRFRRPMHTLNDTVKPDFAGNFL